MDSISSFCFFRGQFRLGQVASLLISSPISADTAFRSKGHFAVLQGMLQDATNFTHLQSFVSCRLIKTSSKLSVHETKDQIE
jgi:hypothetical protein